MVKKQTAQETEAKEVINESPASETLHPDSGSNAGAAPRAHVLASIAGALANVDREKANYWAKTLVTNFGKDFGIDASKWSENQNSIKAHPSDAVGKAVHEDVIEMFKGEELSEDFKTRAAVIFEASINAKVNAALVEAEEQYETRLEEEVAKIAEELEDKVAVHLEYLGTHWLEENAVAIESALRSEVTTSFMAGLRELYTEHNINIPEDSVEVVDALAEKNDELEARLAEAIQQIAELREGQEVQARDAIIAKAKDGMTQADAEKLDALAEGVDAESAEDFTKKVTILAESIKKPAVKTGQKVQELLEETNPDNKVLVEGENVKPVGKVDPSDPMARYLNAINRTIPRETKEVTA